MLRRILATASLIIALSPTALLFQNCGKGFEAGMDTLSSLSTGPLITVSQSPSALINVRSVTIVFSVISSPLANLVRTSCSFDNTTVTDCTGTFNVADLQDGAHSFFIEAEDSAGSISERSVSFQVDATAPTVTINSGPASVHASTTAAVAFTATDNLAGLAVVECSYNGGAFGACSSPRNFTGLTETTHTLRIHARDNAGNTSADVTHTWRVDMTAPVVTIATGPATLTNTRTATFTFSGNDDGMAISGFQCALDSGAYAACTSPMTINDLADGSHSFTVRYTDAFQVVTTAMRTWQVDATLPLVGLTNPPQPINELTSISIGYYALDGNGTAGSGTGVRTECSFDNGAFAACTSPVALSNLALGNHTFTVRAIDGANNVNVASAQWTTNPPSLASVANLGGQSPWSLALNGTTLFVAGRYLKIYDVSNPNSPVLRGTSEEIQSFSETRVLVSGNYAYVTASPSFLIFDVSNITNPVLISRTSTNSYGDVAVLNNTLYKGNLIYNITNRAAPVLTGTFGAESYSVVQMANDHLFVCGSSRGLEIYSLTNPASPSLVGQYSTCAGVPKFSVSGNYLYTASSGSFTRSLQVLNVSNPASPTLVSTTASPGAPTAYDDFYFVKVFGNTMVTHGYSLSHTRFYDISNPVAPRLITRFSQSISDAVIVGNNAILTDRSAGLISVANILTTPTEAYRDEYFEYADLAGFQGANPVFYYKEYRPTMPYGNTYEFVFDAYNFSNPSQPQRLSRLRVPTTQSGVCSARMPYVYCIGNEFLRIISFANPSAPSVVTTMQVPMFYDIEVTATHLYATLTDGPVTAFSLANPVQPTQVGQYTGIRASAKNPRITVAGSHMVLVYWLVNQSGNFYEILDLTNPAVPAKRFEKTVGAGNERYYASSGNIFYETDAGSGISVYEFVSGQAAPVLRSYTSTTGNVGRLTIYGNYLYGQREVWRINGTNLVKAKSFSSTGLSESYIEPTRQLLYSVGTGVSVFSNLLQ